MVETLLAITAEGVAEYDASKTLLTGDGNRSRFAAPQGLYACAGRDELGQPAWAALSVEDETQWRALAALVGRAEWASDPALATLTGRRSAHDAIDAVVAEWCRAQPLERVVSQLLAAGVPAAPVTAARRGAELAPIAQSDFVQTVMHPLAGAVPIPTHPLRFDGMGGRGFARAAPLLGEHNDEILRDRLGLSAEAIDALRKDEIIGERPSGL
jgi:crotonobetainyl-CoA:carnitine CoA-transferase CaiB-like acyl-CoA transferase